MTVQTLKERLAEIARAADDAMPNTAQAMLRVLHEDVCREGIDPPPPIRSTTEEILTDLGWAGE